MRSPLLVTLAAATLLVACGKPSTTKVVDAVQLTPAQVEARLAAADLADGTKDKVVAKCASCRLGMDGDAENASMHAGYELHFCSAECKQRFDADPQKVIAKLPDKPAA
jgi:YHS domain-containing protein